MANVESLERNFILKFPINFRNVLKVFEGLRSPFGEMIIQIMLRIFLKVTLMATLLGASYFNLSHLHMFTNFY